MNLVRGGCLVNRKLDLSSEVRKSSIYDSSSIVSFRLIVQKKNDV